MTKRHRPTCDAIPEAAEREAQAGLQHGPQPGQVYRHHKGGDYEVLFRSVYEPTLEQLVTYRSLERGYVRTRTLANFCEVVDGPDGTRVARFTQINPEEERFDVCS